ncbi:MAG: hypothetical protein MHM6MM_005849, partial [Cercozoa sp. M6MM]
MPYQGYAKYNFPAMVLKVSSSKAINEDRDIVEVHAMLTRYETALQGSLQEMILQRQRPLTLQISLSMTIANTDGSKTDLGVDMQDVEVKLHDTLVQRSVLLKHESLSFRFILNLALMPFGRCTATTRDGTTLLNNPMVPVPFATAFGFLHPAKHDGVSYRLTPTLPVLSELLKFNAEDSEEDLRFDDLSSDLIVSVESFVGSVACKGKCHVHVKYEDLWLYAVTLDTETAPAMGVIPKSPLLGNDFAERQMALDGLARLAYRFAEHLSDRDESMLSHMATAISTFCAESTDTAPPDILEALFNLVKHVQRLVDDSKAVPQSAPALGLANA